MLKAISRDRISKFHMFSLRIGRKPEMVLSTWASSRNQKVECPFIENDSISNQQCNESCMNCCRSISKDTGGILQKMSASGLGLRRKYKLPKDVSSSFLAF